MIKEIISVAVITYNSSKTVIETLNSILYQSYGANYIELIISDDGSSDNTVDVVRDWLFNNESAFNNVKFFANAVNGGIPKNINTAWQASTSQWIKSIAGDDILEVDCISDNMTFVSQHPDCSVVFSKMKWFGDIEKITPEPYHISFFKLSAKEQYRYLRYWSFNVAPTSFIKRDILPLVGFSDEKYRTIEDLPLWLKLTKHGYKLYFLNALTVKYRISTSVSKSNLRYVNVPFLLDLIQINKDNKLPFINNPLDAVYRVEQLVMLHTKILISKVCNNEKNKISKTLDLFSLFLRPFHVYQAIKRHCFNKIKSGPIK
ncbi:glycosyltransferase [Aeromonas caviae]|uniref:glycosyltransferase n=1 Tax=Aeromonas caviae TaxID=648 RepID=UPI0029DB91A3|nr:glycosyltransferase [Aeromonas caviae]MDX7817727.1 glycosyltransferase [Aeromonas caviae]